LQDVVYIVNPAVFTMSVHGGADLKNKLMGVMVFFNLQKNKQVSHAPNTRNGNSAYSAIQFYKQYYEFVV
jgi:hypothetical protein